MVALGALSNLAAIVPNGAFMPASPEAMAAVGKAVPEGYSNSALLGNPDVLIGIGVLWAIVAAMRSGRFASPPVLMERPGVAVDVSA